MSDTTTITTNLLSMPTVAEVMSEKVSVVSQSDTMEDAAALMMREKQSSVAVVDDTGICVGVLTAEDFVRREESQRTLRDTADLASYHHRSQREAESYRIAAKVNNAVAHYMCRNFPTLSPDSSLIDAANVMEDAHACRLVVLDAQRKPIGSLSSVTLLTHFFNRETQVD